MDMTVSLTFDWFQLKLVKNFEKRYGVFNNYMLFSFVCTFEQV